MKLATLRSSSTMRMRIRPDLLACRRPLRERITAAQKGLCSPPLCLSQIVANHLPALHHKFYAFELGNVLQRIARNRDDIGELSFLDRPDAVLPPHHLRRYRRCGLDGLRWSHAVFDQIGEFGGLRPVREWSHAGSKRNLQAARNRQAAAFLTHRFQAVLASGCLSIS